MDVSLSYPIKLYRYNHVQAIFLRVSQSFNEWVYAVRSLQNHIYRVLLLLEFDFFLLRAYIGFHFLV